MAVNQVDLVDVDHFIHIYKATKQDNIELYRMARKYIYLLKSLKNFWFLKNNTQN